MPASRYDSAPLQDNLEPTNPRWRLWFQKVWEQLQAIALPLPSAITVGASPFVYQFQGAGTASVLVLGGTVTTTEFSRNGTTYYIVGVNGMFTVSQGDYLRITYVVAPTMQLVLR